MGEVNLDCFLIPKQVQSTGIAKKVNNDNSAASIMNNNIAPEDKQTKFYASNIVAVRDEIKKLIDEGDQKSVLQYIEQLSKKSPEFLAQVELSYNNAYHKDKKGKSCFKSDLIDITSSWGWGTETRDRIFRSLLRSDMANPECFANTMKFAKNQKGTIGLNEIIRTRALANVSSDFINKVDEILKSDKYPSTADLVHSEYKDIKNLSVTSESADTLKSAVLEKPKVPFKDQGEVLSVQGREKLKEDSVYTKNNGKTSFWKKCCAAFDGITEIVKSPFKSVKNAVVTAATIGAGAAAVAAGIITLPALAVVGGIAGVGLIGYGAYKGLTATDNETAINGWKTVGTGVGTLGLSVHGGIQAKHAQNFGLTPKTAAAAHKPTPRLEAHRNLKEIGKNISIAKRTGKDVNGKTLAELQSEYLTNYKASGNPLTRTGEALRYGAESLTGKGHFGEYNYSNMNWFPKYTSIGGLGFTGQTLTNGAWDAVEESKETGLYKKTGTIDYATQTK